MSILSLIWRTLLFYPVAVFLSLFINTQGFVYQSAVSFLPVMIILLMSGYCVRFFMYRFENKHKKITACAEILSGAVISLLCSLLFLKVNIIAENIFFMILYIAGLRIYIHSFNETINPWYFGVSVTGYIVTEITLHFINKNSDIQRFKEIPLIFLITVCLFMILYNHKNINVLMEKRNYSKEYLPKSTRKVNRNFTVIICIISSLLLLFQKQINAILDFIWKIIKKIVKFILELIISDSEPEEMLPVDSEISEHQQEVEIITSDNRLLNKIFMLIMICIIIALVIRYRRAIAKFFKDLLTDIINAIASVFRSKKKTEKSDFTGYTDYFETIERKQTNEKNTKKDCIHQWKKNLKKYHTMNESNEKYRFGYMLITFFCRMKNKNITECDTPDEMAYKFEEYDISEVTDIYNPIRYGDKKCSTHNINVMNTALDKLRKNLK